MLVVKEDVRIECLQHASFLDAAKKMHFIHGDVPASQCADCTLVRRCATRCHDSRSQRAVFRREAGLDGGQGLQERFKGARVERDARIILFVSLEFRQPLFRVDSVRLVREDNGVRVESYTHFIAVVQEALRRRKYQRGSAAVSNHLLDVRLLGGKEQPAPVGFEVLVRVPSPTKRASADVQPVRSD